MREKRKREVKQLRDALDRTRRQFVEAKREARARAAGTLSDAERERVRKEVVAALEEARDGLGEMIGQGALNTKAIEMIANVHVAFVDELNVAKANAR